MYIYIHFCVAPFLFSVQVVTKPVDMAPSETTSIYNLSFITLSHLVETYGHLLTLGHGKHPPPSTRRVSGQWLPLACNVSFEPSIAHKEKNAFRTAHLYLPIIRIQILCMHIIYGM